MNKYLQLLIIYAIIIIAVAILILYQNNRL